MKHCLIALVAVALLGAADKASDADQKAFDQKALQGTWSLVSIDLGAWKELLGKNGEDIFKDVTVTFKGDKVTASIKGEVGEPSTFRLDVSKKPREISDTKDGDTAIYEIDGDTLRICSRPKPNLFKNAKDDPVESVPPKEFKTSKDSTAILFILKRVTPSELTAEDKKADEERRQAEAAAKKELASAAALSARKAAEEAAVKAAAEEVEKRELAARAKLDLAKQLSSAEARIKKFKEVIEKYPETKAAKDAATLLKKEGGQ
jgi:uncharacterized protein (TIGR03067 family)